MIENREMIEKNKRMVIRSKVATSHIQNSNAQTNMVDSIVLGKNYKKEDKNKNKKKIINKMRCLRQNEFEIGVPSAEKHNGRSLNSK